MPVIQSSAVIGKNEDGSDITQDVDVLVWWRDVGRARFPRIAVMTRQFLTIPEASATAERVFSFAGLTLSDLRKSLLEGTLESIMWAKWGLRWDSRAGSRPGPRDPGLQKPWIPGTDLGQGQIPQFYSNRLKFFAVTLS